MTGSLRGVDDRTSICVTQVFGWQNYGSTPDFREPPAAAKRAMALGAFALGCRGVVQHAYGDRVRRMFGAAGRRYQRQYWPYGS